VAQALKRTRKRHAGLPAVQAAAKENIARAERALEVLKQKESDMAWETDTDLIARIAEQLETKGERLMADCISALAFERDHLHQLLRSILSLAADDDGSTLAVAIPRELWDAANEATK
jgi:methylphosphotriester-DNA--protein-cysteine methyltransferase